MAALALTLTFTFALVSAACLPDLRVFPAETTGARCGDGYVEPGVGDAPGESCDPGEVGAVGCSPTCAVVCEGGVRLATRHCYFTAGQASSYVAASQLCRSKGGGAHVVTFAGEDEVASVDAIVPSGDYWVGLARDATTAAYATDIREEPGYPAAPDTGPCPGCFGRAAIGATPTAAFPDEPGSAGELGCLVASHGAGSAWRRTSCSRPPRAYDVICEREPPGARAEPCPGGVCVRLPFTTKRYLFVATPVSEADAVSSCRGFGARLVVLDSAEEREELAREIARVSPELPSLWVGLARAQGATFVWDDGETGAPKARDLPWADKEPQATGPARAFLDLTRGNYDTRLLRARDEPGRVRPYLCQY